MLVLKILPIPTHNATERAEAISAELFAISRPPVVRAPEDVSNYLFGWHQNEADNFAVLFAQEDYWISVHPQNNLTNLIALFPDLSTQEIQALTNFIQNSSAFPFQAILPSNTEILTDYEITEP